MIHSLVTNSPASPDSAEEIARDVSAVNRLTAVPTLLEVLRETTGMRFAAVARVTESTWTACVVSDDINFGLRRNRPATQGLHRGHAINNGVDSMTFILHFIYREYCRSCFLHIRYL